MSFYAYTVVLNKFLARYSKLDLIEDIEDDELSEDENNNGEPVASINGG